MEEFKPEEFEKDLKNLAKRLNLTEEEMLDKDLVIKRLKEQMRKNNFLIFKNYLKIVWFLIIAILKIPVWLIAFIFILIGYFLNLFGVRERILEIYIAENPIKVALYLINIYDKYITHATICFYLILITIYLLENGNL